MLLAMLIESFIGKREKEKKRNIWLDKCDNDEIWN